MQINPGTYVGSGLYYKYLGIAKVVDSAKTSMTMTDLSLDEDCAYMIYLKVHEATGNAISLSCYFNNDQTATNYDSQRLNVVGTSVSGSRDDTAVFAACSANNYIEVWMYVFRNFEGKAVVHSYSGNTEPNLGMKLAYVKWQTDATVTRMDIVSSVANSLDVGSCFRLYKISPKVLT